MNSNLEFKQLEVDQYQQFLNTVGQADIFQTIGWAEISKYKGWQDYKIFAVVAEDQVLVAGVVYENISKYFGKYMYVLHGPLMSEPGEISAQSWGETPISSAYISALKYWLHELRNYATANNVFSIVLEPLATADSEQAKVFANMAARSQSITTLPKYPMFIDLNHDEDELLAQIGKSTRYNIRQAQKHGVEIEFYYPDYFGSISTKENEFDPVTEFYRVLTSASAKKGYDVPSIKFFEAAWKQFQGSRDVAFVFAKYEGEIISANFTQFSKNWAGSYYTANTNKHSQAKASYLLKWATIIEAKRNGQKVFDMWGQLPNIGPSHPEYGYAQFKKGFRPIEKEFVGRVVIPVSKLKYSLWNTLVELRHH